MRATQSVSLGYLSMPFRNKQGILVILISVFLVLSKVFQFVNTLSLVAIKYLYNPTEHMESILISVPCVCPVDSSSEFMDVLT